MEKEFNCDFYFGDKVNTSIKKIDYLELDGFKAELLNYSGRYFQLRKGVWKLALKKEYENYLISWEPLNISLWIFLLLCKFQGKKVYSWQHGISKKKISKKFELLEKFSMSLKAGTFLYGHYARNNMIRLGFNPEKLHVIYNSLDYKRHLELRKSKRDQNIYLNHFNNIDPVILFIGRLTPVKKLHLIIEAHKRLIKTNVPCNVVFIGDGDVKEQLELLIAKYNLKGRYLFTGALYDESIIANYLSSADVCVSPGNVGLTAIHCLSYGLPVIIHDNFETQMPEFEAIQEGVSGSFFEEDDIDSLTQTIKNWLQFSSIKRDEIRKKCYEIIDSKYNPLNQIKILNHSIFK